MMRPPTSFPAAMPRQAAPLRVLAACLLVLGLGAEDWPHARGPLTNGHVPEAEAVPTSLPSEATVVWKVKIGDGFASPIEADGVVYYLDCQADQDVIHAVTAASGKQLWQESVFSSHKDGFGEGPRCAPVADGKLLFVQTSKGEFHCLATATGKLLWRFNFVDDFGGIYIGEKGDAKGGSRHGFNGSPVIDGDLIYVEVGSPKGAGVVCFRKATGAPVWKSQNDMAGYGPPLIATICGIKQLVCFTVDGVIGLRANDGTLLWRVPLTTTFGRHVIQPIVDGDLVVVASHQFGMVGTRIVKQGVGLVAQPAWTKKELGINFSSPVAVGGHLYGLGLNKNVMCVDLASGQVAWDQGGCISSSGDKAFAGFIVMGANILMLNDSGELILFAADASRFNQVGRLQVCGSNWCSPAYANGRLYLRDRKELRCIELLH